MNLLKGVPQPAQTNLNSTDFLIPDTVCVNEPFTITNLSQGSTTYYWSFCTSDAGATPFGLSMPMLSSNVLQPGYVALVMDAGKYYTFITNEGDGTVTRNYNGKNLFAPPVSSLKFGNFGVLNFNVRGIQVKTDNGNWYGFVADDDMILRLDFGVSLLNIPTTTNYTGAIGTLPGMNGLTIVNDGTGWIGFCTSFTAQSLLRLVWGNSLTNTPVATNLGNIGSLNSPSQCTLNEDGTDWYMMIANEGDNSLSRLSFGNSLQNVPTGTNLGNVGSLDHDQGILLTRDCGALNGFALNNITGNDVLVRLDFPGGISGPVTGQLLSNFGSMDQPGTFSELIRGGDTLYTVVANTGGSTLSLIYFTNCSNSSIPSSTLRNPPPVSYSAPGQYNIMLVTDEGLPTQQNVCKRITVMPPLSVNLGNDTLVCSGKTVTLDAGPGDSVYQWSNGSATQTIQTDKPGTYWVHVINRWKCEASDTIFITQMPAVVNSIDTTVCYGIEYHAGNHVHGITGTYTDTLRSPAGCDSVLISHLAVKPEIPLDLGGNRSICPGETIMLHATYPGSTYSWQDASSDSVYLVTQPGIYWVHVTYDNCTTGDTVRITDCPAELWFPTAFTPNGDGNNDLFRPKGISISNFHMMIFDRWGQMLYETKYMEKGWDGTAAHSLCPPGTYTFIATYEGTENPGDTKKVTGSFSLVR